MYVISGEKSRKVKKSGEKSQENSQEKKLKGEKKVEKGEIEHKHLHGTY